eukprot:5932332-Amphidinium_carterae.1
MEAIAVPIRDIQKPSQRIHSCDAMLCFVELVASEVMPPLFETMIDSGRTHLPGRSRTILCSVLPFSLQGSRTHATLQPQPQAINNF